MTHYISVQPFGESVLDNPAAPAAVMQRVPCLEAAHDDSLEMHHIRYLKLAEEQTEIEDAHAMNTRLDVEVTLLFFAIYLFCHQSPSSSAYGRR